VGVGEPLCPGVQPVDPHTEPGACTRHCFRTGSGTMARCMRGVAEFKESG
jgi:hypothetical protein